MFIYKSQNIALSRKKFIYATLLGIVMLLYASLYFSNTFPLSEGWNVNYAELILHGKLPYKDFYYYLPPLNLLIDIIVWPLSFGSLFLYRAWWLLQRIVIFELLFFLFCRYFKPLVAFLGCAFGSILATASVYDLFGDYNQTTVLLSIVLIYCAIEFAKAQTIKGKCHRMLASGAVIALLFFCKQTIFVSSFFTYLSALTVISIRDRDKNYWRYVLSTAVGFLAVVLPVIIFMACFGMLIPFIEQVFLNTGGKGSLFVIIFEKLFGKLFSVIPWLICALLLISITLAKKGKKLQILARCIFAVFIIALCVVNLNELKVLAESATRSPTLTAIMIIGTVPLFTVTILKLIKKGPPILRTTDAVCIATVFWSIVTLAGGYFADAAVSEDITRSLYNSENIFDLVSELFYFVIFYFVIVNLVTYIAKHKKAEIDSDTHQLLWIACGAFSAIYSSIMVSGGGEIAYYSITIGITFILCKAFSMVLKDKFLEMFMRSGMVILCTLLCFICMSQKIIAPYTWWGSGTPSPAGERIYSADISALKGFKFTESTKNKYEQVTKLILENTDEDDVVYGFPYVKLFNILTDRYQYDTFVPVMFYDVVDDKYVALENELLRQKLPDILIIQDIPECMETHEAVFRDGNPLVQRETLSFFKSVIVQRYELLGTFEDITVYKLLPE